MLGTFSNFAAEQVANSSSRLRLIGDKNLFYIFIVELKENRYNSQFDEYFYFIFFKMI